MKKIIAIIAILLLVTVSTWAGPKISKNGGGSAGTGDVATDAIWDTAGDMVYGTGANTAQKLAIGTAYQLLMTNAGATAPAWTLTLGATGTRLTKGWFTDLEVTNSPTVGGTALSALYQPLDTQLTALASATTTTNLTDITALTPVANALLGWNGSTVMSALTTISVRISDSSAQFHASADTTALVGVSAASITTGKAAWLKPAATDNASYLFQTIAADAYVPTGNIVFSGPTTTSRTKYLVGSAATIIEASATTITKYEYLPIRYAEDDDGGSTPATVSELTTSTMVARLFDATTAESVIFWWQVPADYAAGIKYRVYYGLVASASTDDTAAFSLAGCSVASGEAIVCSEGTAIVIAQELSTTTDAQWDLMVTGWSEAVTVTGIAAGEMARLLFSRAVASDDVAQDLGVTGIEIKYQAKINSAEDY
jgi:hypothetical protein